ncbi:MAG: hypothetical protein ACHQZQ_02935 [SAR324 cluster bacterium]
MAGKTRKRGRTARMRGVVASVASAGGVFVLLAAGCSPGGPTPPDMPPFAGTEAFLQEQARVQRALEAEEALPEKLRLGNRAVDERRYRAFFMMQRETAERARRQDLARQRAQERALEQREREWAAEAGRLY